MCDDDEPEDPRCSCGHFRSEHEGDAILSTMGNGILVDAGYCQGAYHTLHHDFERPQVEASCSCQRFHLPDEFHPGFLEVNSR